MNDEVSTSFIFFIKPFQVNVPFLFPQKAQKTRGLGGIERDHWGIKKEYWPENCLMQSLPGSYRWQI